MTLEQELQHVAEYNAEREARKIEQNHWIAEGMEAAFSRPTTQKREN